MIADPDPVKRLQGALSAFTGAVHRQICPALTPWQALRKRTGRAWIGQCGALHLPPRPRSAPSKCSHRDPD